MVQSSANLAICRWPKVWRPALGKQAAEAMAQAGAAHPRLWQAESLLAELLPDPRQDPDH